jgi:hypothetical protein
MKFEDNKTVPTGRAMLYYYFDGKEWGLKREENFEVCDWVDANVSQELEKIRQQVHDGKLSPLAYHIHNHLYGYAYTLSGREYSLDLLSSYVGIPKRHIKKHLKPENFTQLDEVILKKYAEIFEISIEELINV